MRRLTALTVALALSGLLLLVGPGPFGARGLAGESRNAADEVDGEGESRQAIARLVRQLGDDSFQRRRAATARLAEIGVAAKPWLLPAMTDADAEIRFRARRVLAVVDAVDFQRRLEAFAADLDGALEHDLPGWRRFQEAVGDDPAARRLFTDMQRAEPVLMKSLEAEAAAASEVFQLRCTQLYQSLYGRNRTDRKEINPASVASLFFVAAAPDVVVEDQMGSYLANFSHLPQFRKALAEERSSTPVRNVVATWIRKGLTWNSVTAYQNLVLAMRLDMREGLELARSLLAQPGAPVHIRQYSVLAIGKFGDCRHAALLEPLLEDDTPCATYRRNDQIYRTEIRDVALASLIHLAELDHAAYGFQRVQRNSHVLFNVATLGFADEDHRAEALRKWRERAPADDAPDAE